MLEALPLIGFPDVLHCNDWQTGMIPALLQLQYARKQGYAAIKTVFTIHNLKYQGVFPWMYIDDLLGIGEDYFTPDKLEYFGRISYIKGGLVFADKITTVSPTYAKEIQTVFCGERLEGLIQSRAGDLVGILNGIDVDDYNPQNDKAIAANFSPRLFNGKQECKRALQSELGLEYRDVPILALVTRLTEQKGLDLIECVLEDIMRKDIQLVVLGRGEERYQELFSWASWRYQGRLAARIELNMALARRIYAGADVLLMPSQFEPCGIAQMIAMRYGTVPVVRETGGLKDTVMPYNMFNDTGTGFSFANYNAHEMLFTIERAQEYYFNKPVWDGIMKRCMRENFSWDASAKKYLKLYSNITSMPLAAAKSETADGSKTAGRTNRPTSKKGGNTKKN